MHQDIADLKYKIVFCTPERLTKDTVNSKKFKELLLQLYNRDKIARFVLDEIHVVKTWGDDFRPAYKALSTLK